MSESNISTELQRVVLENISDVEMAVFQREMNRLQGLELEYVKLREDHKTLTEEHQELTATSEKSKSETESILAREKELGEREAEMAAQKTQLHIENKLIELRHQNAVQRVEDHKHMVQLIFRGPVFQKSVVESRTHETVTPLALSESGMQGAVQNNYLTDTKTVETKDEQV